MRFRLFRRTRTEASPAPSPGPVPRERPVWATAATTVFPTLDAGRAGNLTPAQQWRANGGHRPGDAR